MLQELKISNFAIIDDLAIPFGPGLNVLTGETGAGKSIIIEALGLITGDRALADLIRSGKKEAHVEAVFNPKTLSDDLTARLEDAGLRDEENLVIKRSIFDTGRSKAYINGRPVPLTELKRLSLSLLEISSQHEHQSLLNEETHLELVDRFGSSFEMREEYRDEFLHYISLKDRLKELEKLSDSATEQREFLSYQIKEIDGASLKEGEEEELIREKNVVKNAARLLESVRSSDELLYSSENSVGSALSRADELLSSAGEIDPVIKSWLPLLKEASVAVDEISRNLSGYLESLDIDPARLEVIESRLFDIRRLKKKYGSTVDDILLKRDELAAKLDLIENCESEIEGTKAEIKSTERSLKKLAERLSDKRIRSAEKLTKLVQKELDTLGLKKTTFVPGHVRLAIHEADETGIDRFNFLISPNPGEPVKPLARIASGGELSRVMLAIKRVLMDKVSAATLEVFDEVDQGIGGAVAEMVGVKLKEMSLKKQIVSITHLPQVAYLSDHQNVVSKYLKDKRTVARFELLDNDGRVDEIARMLGGSKITKATIDHAIEMLRMSEEF